MAVEGIDGRRREKRKSREEAPDSVWVWRMGGLLQDETAEPVPRDQIRRRVETRGCPRVGLATIYVQAQSAERYTHDIWCMDNLAVHY